MKIVVFMLLCLSSAHANTTFTESEIIEARERADQWRITESDWHQYRELMDGPRGIWSPDADPLVVLGAAATSPAERQRLAEIFVQLEHERVSGELAFQRAINQAWANLYPQTQRLPAKAERDVPASLQAQRYAVIVEPDCAACDAMLGDYLERIKAGAVSVLDVYVRKIGADDGRLRDYVAQSGIPIDLIQDRKITVNHGTDYETGNAPEAYVLSGGGQWQQL